MAIIGLVPAAGYGTRLQPLERSKEMCIAGGRPVMDYLIERMRMAPCDDLRVVTRPEKTDVVVNARRHGAEVVEARPATLGESVLAGSSGLSPDDVVLLGFPDSIWEPLDGYRALLQLLEAGFEVGLGLFRAKDLSRYEPVALADGGRVRGIEFKPKRPSSEWLWGCAAVRVRALSGLEGFTEPGIYFDSLCASGVVGGTRLSERYLDIGTHEGLREAQEALG